MLKFDKEGRRYTTRAGILYLLIEDYGTYNWYICNDFEDKCEEYAMEQGNCETFDEAHYSVMQACKRVAQRILEDIS